MKTATLFLLFLRALSFSCLWAQTGPAASNLVHPPGYECSAWGDLPYQKYGTGPKNLLLLPGWGFDAGVFREFIEKNLQNYTMYALQLPGYGETRAYQMPAEGISYGAGYWLKGVEAGLLKLIETERLRKPILVAHFAISTHLALELAAQHPDKVGKVVIVGGPAAFRNQPPYDTLSYRGRVRSVDLYLAPHWFKTVSRETWLNGNFPPNVYSADSLRGKVLFDQANTAPLPVQIRYLCENWAADHNIYEQVKIPVLTIVPVFPKSMLDHPKLLFLKWYTDDWDVLAGKNKNIRVTKVAGTGCNVMQDRLQEFNRLLSDFLAD